VPGQLQGVGLHPRLQGPPHFGSGAEEAVGRHQAIDPLVRALEIIMVDEMPDTLAGIAQVDEHRALDALAPQAAPEALDLTQRLRPPRRRYDLLNAALL